MLNIFNVYKCLRDRGSVQTPVAYAAYLASKRAYRVNLITAKRQAYEQFIETSSNKYKAAWEVINFEKCPLPSKDAQLDPELTNNFFLNSVTELSRNLPPISSSFTDFLGNTPSLPNCFHWKVISIEDLVKIVAKLSNSRSMDFYWLSNNIIKKTIHAIKKPLTFVFNKCLEQGFFPDSLKVSKVIPIYKKGAKDIPQSYRPVSIVPIFSKILETVMHQQLYKYFEHSNLLSESQFGFRTGRSTTSAVLEVVNNSLQAFENKESVALSLLDLSKAFDCVPFDIIIYKLQHYGISNSACQIIISYLSNRKQFVSIKGSKSSMKDVTIGVPQGSVLGPFFFTVVMNDLPSNLSVKSVIYADDTSLFSCDKREDFLQAQINTAQNEALNWFTSNKLHCNPDKTQNLLLSLSSIEPSQPVKLLGFYIDSKLSWSDHVNSVCSRISRVSFLMWKLCDLVSFEHLRSCYFAFFQSHISYGLILWGHSSRVTDILIIQKKVVRTLCGAKFLEHCRPLFIQAKILTVINLYIYHILIYTKANLNLFSTRQNFHLHATRYNYKLDLPQHCLSKTGSSHVVNCIRFFNKLHFSAHTTELNNFKSKLATWLQANPFYSIDEFLNIDAGFTF